jgi:hypothetical protein
LLCSRIVTIVRAAVVWVTFSGKTLLRGTVPTTNHLKGSKKTTTTTGSKRRGKVAFVSKSKGTL